MIRVLFALPLAALVAFSAVGCATQPPGEDGRVTIATSTDVYGSIARAVAGDHAEITSIIDRPAQDPHSYEATARDRLSVSRADIVVMNGGGYDPFMEQLVAGVDSARVIVAYGGPHGGARGDNPDDAEGSSRANEHVWYDLQLMQGLAETIMETLVDIDRAHAATYEQNARVFLDELGDLREHAMQLAERFRGLGGIITEPAPELLLDELGVRNLTPTAYTRAVESGIDVAPATLLEVLDVIERGDVRVVVWNAQTTGPEIERLVTAARDAGIPVVEVTETLPPRTEYLQWMTAVIDELESALQR